MNKATFITYARGKKINTNVDTVELKTIVNSGLELLRNMSNLCLNLVTGNFDTVLNTPKENRKTNEKYLAIKKSDYFQSTSGKKNLEAFHYIADTPKQIRKQALTRLYKSMYNANKKTSMSTQLIRPRSLRAKIEEILNENKKVSVKQATSLFIEPVKNTAPKVNVSKSVKNTAPKVIQQAEKIAQKIVNMRKKDTVVFSDTMLKSWKKIVGLGKNKNTPSTIKREIGILDNLIQEQLK